MRDQHAGCVGSYLVEHDLFDFLLLSLPDNDAHSHKNGPHAQIQSIAAADAELWRVMEAGGGVDAFLDEHAMIVMADHSHSHIERTIDFRGPFADWRVLPPSGAGARNAELALCPAQRSAMIYLLLESRDAAIPRVVATAREMEGVDLVMWWEDAPGGRRVRIGGQRGELSFAPGGDVADARGRRWSVDGELDALLATVQDGVLSCEHYPDAPGARLGGDVLPDLGRRAALRRARLRVSRLGQPRPRARRQPRLAASRRLARRAAVLRRRGAGRAGRRQLVDRRRRADDRRPLRRRVIFGAVRGRR